MTTRILGYLAGVAFTVGIVLAIFIPCSAYFIFAHGYVLSKLWGWFVTPLGVPAITLLHASGIMGVIRLCTYDASFTPKSETTETSTTKKFGHLFGLMLVPWVSLLFGYIIHRLM